MLNGMEKKLCRPKRGWVVHNNTEHHGTNIDHLLFCISVEGGGDINLEEHHKNIYWTIYI